MNDSPPDDSHLHDAEAKMRRALGLTGDTPVPSTPHQLIIGGNGSRPQRRQFVRDGDVPVTIIHHQSGGESTNQLDAARNAMRSLATAKERAERFLEQAQETIRQLQTKLAHERLAHDEALQRAEADRKTVEHPLQTVRTELAAEKIARERSEQALRDAQRTISDLTEKLNLSQQATWTVQEAAGRPMVEDRQQTVQKARKAVGRPRKATVGKTAKKPREKPVKWWLGER